MYIEIAWSGLDEGQITICREGFIVRYWKRARGYLNYLIRSEKLQNINHRFYKRAKGTYYI